MKTIIKTHEVQCFNSRLMEQYFHGMRIGVFDIETMGLNPERSPLILSGMLTTRPDGGCLITQHFAENYRYLPAGEAHLPIFPVFHPPHWSDTTHSTHRKKG